MPNDDEIQYSTTDQIMIEALLMRGHSPTEIMVDDQKQLTYHFAKDVFEDVRMIQTNRAGELTITLQDWWRAKYTWQINLRHYLSDKPKRKA